MKLLRAAAIVAALMTAAATSSVMAQGIGTAGYEMKYGDEYMGAREYDKAAMRYRQATELDPTSAEAYFRLAKAYTQLRQTREAAEALNRAYALNPALKARQGELPNPAQPPAARPAGGTGIGTAGYEMKYGDEYMGDREYDKAALRYRQATQLDPTNAEAYFRLAKAYLQLQRIGDASQALNRAYALDPSLKAREGELPDPARPAPTPQQPWTGLNVGPGGPPAIGTSAREEYYGKQYLAAKQYDVAAMRLRQAVELDPNNAEAQFWLAGAYRGLGQNAAGQQAFNRALQLDPSLQAHAADLLQFKPPAPAPQPAPKPPQSQPPKTAANTCDDLYATCNASAYRCSLYNTTGCSPDFGRQAQCTTERNACYSRNGVR